MNDSLRLAELEAKVNYLQKNQQNTIDSLKNEIDKIKVSESYFSSIIDSTHNLMIQQTEIFLFAIGAIIAVAGLISWKFIFQKMVRKINKQENDISEVTKKLEKIDNVIASNEKLARELLDIKSKTLRSLYESRKAFYEDNKKGHDLKWTVIWHIRYCETFLERSEIHGLSIRIGELKQEFDRLTKDHHSEFEKLLKFENIQELEIILKKLIRVEEKDDAGLIKDIEKVVLYIFNKLKNR